MSPTMPILKDEAFLEERRRIYQRLIRLQKFAAPESGFPSVLSSLLACMDEIEGLLPGLAEHFSREERVLQPAPGGASPDEQQKAEQIVAEHLPLTRELRALLESGRRVIEDLRAGRDAGSLAEALKAYLTACIQDLLEHEEREGILLAGGDVSSGRA